MVSVISRKIRGGIRRARFALLRARHSLPTITLADLGAADVDVEQPLLDDVCMPPFAGSSQHDDLFAVLRTAAARQPRVIVELGTAHGNLTANLCRVAPEAHIFTVNAEAEQQTGTAITYSLTAGDIGRVYRAAGYGNRVTQILCNTLDLDLARHLAGRPIDLAIIDACHDIDFVINDFYKLEGHVAEGGLVFFHDTHPSLEGHLRQSYTACMMLRRAGYDIRHLEQTWWGVWRKASQ